MLRELVFAISLVPLTSNTAHANEPTVLGYGSFFSNDFFGDGHDRWRTGSYVLSQIWGRPYLRSQRSSHPGELVELRFRSEILSPDNLRSPNQDDRLYSGILSFGVHTHFDVGILETSLGMDVVAVGKQTGLSSFQRKVHEFIGDKNSGPIEEIDDAIYPSLLGEIGMTHVIGAHSSARIFVEAQAGVETLLRVGGDLEIGETCNSSLKIRDVSTGHRYGGITCQRKAGRVATVGFDVAKVFDSEYLPEARGLELADTRVRIRVGILGTGEHHSVFYGVTWLGKEFTSQAQDQVLGSISLRLAF